MVEHRLANARKSIVNDAIFSANTMEFLITRTMEIKTSYFGVRFVQFEEVAPQTLSEK